MTTTSKGLSRAQYAKISKPPSRFANNGKDYAAWAKRADAWAAKKAKTAKRRK